MCAMKNQMAGPQYTRRPPSHAAKPIGYHIPLSWRNQLIRTLATFQHQGLPARSRWLERCSTATHLFFQVGNLIKNIRCVIVKGVEPLTVSLGSWRSIHWAKRPMSNGLSFHSSSSKRYKINSNYIYLRRCMDHLPANEQMNDPEHKFSFKEICHQWLEGPASLKPIWTRAVTGCF